jgi:anti-sigma regulatory factor (Ser/Thr protein kinase)
MTLTTVTKPHTTYRHEAFWYRGTEEFVSGLVPFVRDGVAAGQPVMVAAIAPRLERLRTALGADADRVQFHDMGQLGSNPAQIIPAWRAFVDAHGDQPLRGIGEPIWAGRREAELLECQLHEALLNLAVDPDTPLWLRCPYDLEALGCDVIEEAQRSHPVLVDAELDDDAYWGSTRYGGVDHATSSFARDLAEPTVPTERLSFLGQSLPAVASLVATRAAAAGLDDGRVAEVVRAVQQVALNSVRHGGGSGELRIWREPDAFVCEVRDHGHIDDPLVGRRAPATERARQGGLWLVNQLCDLVQVRSTEYGSTVRMLTWL